MKQFLWLAVFYLLAHRLSGQAFEITRPQETYKGIIGEIIKAPLQFKNTTDKPVTLIIRKQTAEIGGTQKNYFCLDNHCLDSKVEDYLIRIEPGQTFNLLHIALEAGLAPGNSVVKYTATNKANPSEIVEFDLHFAVEEKAEKENIYNSRHIILHNVYPNPVDEFAYVDYKVLDDQIKAKIVLHNILGTPIGDYSLPPLETKVKIKAESLNAGIYFYTLYLDNEGVITRKLIVKK
jgi:hypothetical protein